MNTTYNTHNVENWTGGWRNLVWSVIYSIVRKRHKENPDQVNGDYFLRLKNNQFFDAKEKNNFSYF